MLSSPKQGMSANDTAKALADRYLQAAFPPNTRYDVDKLIPLLRDGDPSKQLAPLNSWTVPGGLPYACGLLNLTTCHKDGPVWDALKVTVTGQGLGVLDGLLGSLVGGLLINRCDSLLGNLIDYNGCVRNNLASYIQTATLTSVRPSSRPSTLASRLVSRVPTLLSTGRSAARIGFSSVHSSPLQLTLPSGLATPLPPAPSRKPAGAVWMYAAGLLRPQPL